MIGDLDLGDGEPGGELGVAPAEELLPLCPPLPAGRGDLVAMARRDGEVLSEEYSDGVVSMRARVSAPVAGRLRKAAHVQG